MLEELSKKPYASLSLLMLYWYFHIFEVVIKSREIDFSKMGDSVYNIATSGDKMFTIAWEFDYINRDSFSNRKKYFQIIDRYIDFCNDPKLPII